MTFYHFASYALLSFSTVSDDYRSLQTLFKPSDLLSVQDKYLSDEYGHSLSLMYVKSFRKFSKIMKFLQAHANLLSIQSEI
jgi:hypothetical protein